MHVQWPMIRRYTTCGREDHEYDVRLEAAMDMLALSSANLKDVIFSGPADAVESAYVSLRFARVRFLQARADCRDMGQASNL